MGTLQVSGTGMDLFIGRAGAHGEITVYNGAWLDARKATEILNGRLTLYPHAQSQQAKDEYVIDNGGTLAFIAEHDRVATITGTTLALELGANSTLELMLTGDFDINDSWTLMTGLSTIGGVQGGDGTGVFGNVVSPQGFGFEITYTPQSASGAGDGTLVATLKSAVAIPVIPPDLYNVPVTTPLQWKAGSLTNVTGYDVYFSTDPNLPESSRVVTNQLVNSYDPPGDLAYGTVYFWRVDAHEPNEMGDQIRKGGLWSFTTEPPTPQVLVHPDPLQIIAAGGTAELTVDVLNGEFFQWYKEGDPAPLTNGGDISGADTATLTISNLERADEGFYYCQVSNTLSQETAVSNAGRIMTQRMVAHWTFEDTLVDEVDGWTGVYVDPATGIEETPVFVPVVNDANEPAGKAIEFFDDGKNVRIHDPADPEYFNFYTHGMTVSCWIKTDVVNGGATMVSKQKPNAWDGWVLQNPDNPQFTIQRMTDETVAGPDSLTDGKWHMVTGSFDGKSIRLYVDATLVDVSAENTELLLTPGDALVIGANNPDGGGSFDGLIDDVQIWNYAIDPIEIARLYATKTGRPACTQIPPFDLDGNCVVDLNDIVLFAGQWAVSNVVNPD